MSRRKSKPALSETQANTLVRKAHAEISLQIPAESGCHYYVPIAGAEALRPCPFCRERAFIDIIDQGANDMGAGIKKRVIWARAQCLGCGIHGPEADAGSEGEDDSIHGLCVEAARMWNERKGGAK